MHSFLSKVFGRKKEDKETSPTTLRPGELLDGKFEAVSPNVSPGAANFLELDGQTNAETAKDKDKDVVFSLFRAKSRPSPPEIRGKKPVALPHLSLDFSAINGDSNANNLLTLDQTILSDAIIGRRRLNPMEALVLIRACSQAIVATGLETLGVMHPHWYSASPEVQRRLISQFIHSMEPKTPPTAFSPNSTIVSPFESEVESTHSPHDIAAVLRWGLRHLRLDGDSFGTDDGWYKTFLDAEAAAEYPPKAFTEKLAPLLPPAHLDLLVATLEVFSYLAAHSEVNGTSGSKLSKIFGLWLLASRQVEDKDDWQTFYARWERTGRMLEHLFLSRIRDESTDQRMPVRLLELVRRYPYTQGLSSPTTDLQLLPRPQFTTQCFDAFFVRIEVELPSERRKPTLKVHPLNILADAFSTKVEEGEFAELWGKITAASKDGSNPSPLSNIFADETIRLLSIIPDKNAGKAVEPKSPTFSLLPVSPSSPRGRSFSVEEPEKPTPVQHTKSATEPPPASAISAISIGSDWAQFSSSGFLDTNPNIAPLVSTLFDTDVEKTVPPVNAVPLSRKSSKRKAASRKSVDFSAEPVKPIPEVQAEVVKEEPKAVVRATKLQVIQIDEAFIDFWSDSLLDPITATWPTFIICKFKSTLAPQLQYAAGEAGAQKTLKWLVLEQVITVKPAPAPVLPASPTTSVSETARPVSPALSTSGRNRFSFWSMSRTASSSSQSSQKGKKKEKALNVGEMGELLEEESTDQVKSAPSKVKSFSKSRKSTTEKPKESTRKSVDVHAAKDVAPTSAVEAQVPVADKVAQVETSDKPGVSLAVGAAAAVAAVGATAAIASAVESQPSTSEVAKEETTTQSPSEDIQAPEVQEVKSEVNAVEAQVAPAEPVETPAIETSAEPVVEVAPVAEVKEETEAAPAAEASVEPIPEPLEEAEAVVETPAETIEAPVAEGPSAEPDAEIVPDVVEAKVETEVDQVTEATEAPVARSLEEVAVVATPEETVEAAIIETPSVEPVEESGPAVEVKDETEAVQVPEVTEAPIAESQEEETVIDTPAQTIGAAVVEPVEEITPVVEAKEETEAVQVAEVSAEPVAEPLGEETVVDTPVPIVEAPTVESPTEPIAEVAPVVEVEEVTEAAPVPDVSAEPIAEPLKEEVVGATPVETVAVDAPIVEVLAEPISEVAPVAEAEEETEAAPVSDNEDRAAPFVEAAEEEVVVQSIETEPSAEPVSETAPEVEVEEETEATQEPEVSAAPVDEPSTEEVIDIAPIEIVEPQADESSSAEPVSEVVPTVEANEEAEAAQAPEVSATPLVEPLKEEAVVDAQVIPPQTLETPAIETSAEPVIENAPIAEAGEETETAQVLERGAISIALAEEAVAPAIESPSLEPVSEIAPIVETQEETEGSQLPEVIAAPVAEQLEEEAVVDTQATPVQTIETPAIETSPEPVSENGADVAEGELAQELEVDAVPVAESSGEEAVVNAPVQAIESPVPEPSSLEAVPETALVVEAKEEIEADQVTEVKDAPVTEPLGEEAVSVPEELSIVAPAAENPEETVVSSTSPSEPAPAEEIADVVVEQAITIPEVDEKASGTVEEEIVAAPASITESLIVDSAEVAVVEPAAVEKDLVVDSQPELAAEVEPAQLSDVVAPVDDTLPEEPATVPGDVIINAQAQDNIVEAHAQETLLSDLTSTTDVADESIDPSAPGTEVEPPTSAEDENISLPEPTTTVDKPSLEEPVAAPAALETPLEAQESALEPVAETPVKDLDTAEVIQEVDAPQPTIAKDSNVAAEEHAPEVIRSETLEEPKAAPVEDVETEVPSVEMPATEIVARDLAAIAVAAEIPAEVTATDELKDSVDEEKHDESKLDAPAEVSLQEGPIITEALHSEAVPVSEETQTFDEASVAETLPVETPVSSAEEEPPVIEREMPPAKLDEAEEEVQQQEASNIPPVVEEANLDVEGPSIIDEQFEAPSEPINIASSIPTVVPIAISPESPTEALIDIPPIPLVEAPSEPVEGAHVTVLVQDEATKEIEPADTALNNEVTDVHLVPTPLILAGSIPGPQASLSPTIVEPEEGITRSLDSSDVPEDNTITTVEVEEDSADVVSADEVNVTDQVSKDSLGDSVEPTSEQMDLQDPVDDITDPTVNEHQQEIVHEATDDSVLDKSSAVTEVDSSMEEALSSSVPVTSVVEDVPLVAAATDVVVPAAEENTEEEVSDSMPDIAEISSPVDALRGEPGPDENSLSAIGPTEDDQTVNVTQEEEPPVAPTHVGALITEPVLADNSDTILVEEPAIEENHPIPAPEILEQEKLEPEAAVTQEETIEDSVTEHIIEDKTPVLDTVPDEPALQVTEEANVEELPEERDAESVLATQQDQVPLPPTEAIIFEKVADRDEPPASLLEPASGEPVSTAVEEHKALEEPLETSEQDIPPQEGTDISAEEPVVNESAPREISEVGESEELLQSETATPSQEPLPLEPEEATIEESPATSSEHVAELPPLAEATSEEIPFAVNVESIELAETTTSVEKTDTLDDTRAIPQQSPEEIKESDTEPSVHFEQSSIPEPVSESVVVAEPNTNDGDVLLQRDSVSEKPGTEPPVVEDDSAPTQVEDLSTDEKSTLEEVDGILEAAVVTAVPLSIEPTFENGHDVIQEQQIVTKIQQDQMADPAVTEEPTTLSREILEEPSQTEHTTAEEGSSSAQLAQLEVESETNVAEEPQSLAPDDIQSGPSSNLIIENPEVNELATVISPEESNTQEPVTIADSSEFSAEKNEVQDQIESAPEFVVKPQETFGDVSTEKIVGEDISSVAGEESNVIDESAKSLHDVPPAKESDALDEEPAPSIPTEEPATDDPKPVEDVNIEQSTSVVSDSQSEQILIDGQTDPSGVAVVSEAVDDSVSPAIEDSPALEEQLPAQSEASLEQSTNEAPAIELSATLSEPPPTGQSEDVNQDQSVVALQSDDGDPKEKTSNNELLETVEEPELSLPNEAPQAEEFELEQSTSEVPAAEQQSTVTDDADVENSGLVKEEVADDSLDSKIDDTLEDETPIKEEATPSELTAVPQVIEEPVPVTVEESIPAEESSAPDTLDASPLEEESKVESTFDPSGQATEEPITESVNAEGPPSAVDDTPPIREDEPAAGEPQVEEPITVEERPQSLHNDEPITEGDEPSLEQVETDMSTTEHPVADVVTESLNTSKPLEDHESTSLVALETPAQEQTRSSEITSDTLDLTERTVSPTIQEPILVEEIPRSLPDDVPTKVDSEVLVEQPASDASATELVDEHPTTSEDQEGISTEQPLSTTDDVPSEETPIQSQEDPDVAEAKDIPISTSDLTEPSESLVEDSTAVEEPAPLLQGDVLLNVSHKESTVEPSELEASAPVADEPLATEQSDVAEAVIVEHEPVSTVTDTTPEGTPVEELVGSTEEDVAVDSSGTNIAEAPISVEEPLVEVPNTVDEPKLPAAESDIPLENPPMDELPAEEESVAAEILEPDASIATEEPSTESTETPDAEGDAVPEQPIFSVDEISPQEQTSISEETAEVTAAPDLAESPAIEPSTTLEETAVDEPKETPIEPVVAEEPIPELSKDIPLEEAAGQTESTPLEQSENFSEEVQAMDEVETAKVPDVPVEHPEAVLETAIVADDEVVEEDKATDDAAATDDAVPVEETALTQPESTPEESVPVDDEAIPEEPKAIDATVDVKDQVEEVIVKESESTPEEVLGDAVPEEADTVDAVVAEAQDLPVDETTETAVPVEEVLKEEEVVDEPEAVERQESAPDPVEVVSEEASAIEVAPEEQDAPVEATVIEEPEQTQIPIPLDAEVVPKEAEAVDETVVVENANIPVELATVEEPQSTSEQAEAEAVPEETPAIDSAVSDEQHDVLIEGETVVEPTLVEPTTEEPESMPEASIPVDDEVVPKEEETIEQSVAAEDSVPEEETIVEEPVLAAEEPPVEDISEDPKTVEEAAEDGNHPAEPAPVEEPEATPTSVPVYEEPVSTEDVDETAAVEEKDAPTAEETTVEEPAAISVEPVSVDVAPEEAQAIETTVETPAVPVESTIIEETEPTPEEPNPTDDEVIPREAETVDETVVKEGQTGEGGDVVDEPEPIPQDPVSLDVVSEEPKAIDTETVAEDRVVPVEETPVEEAKATEEVNTVDEAVIPQEEEISDEAIGAEGQGVPAEEVTVPEPEETSEKPVPVETVQEEVATAETKAIDDAFPVVVQDALIEETTTEAAEPTQEQPAPVNDEAVSEDSKAVDSTETVQDVDTVVEENTINQPELSEEAIAVNDEAETVGTTLSTENPDETLPAEPLQEQPTPVNEEAVSENSEAVDSTEIVQDLDKGVEEASIKQAELAEETVAVNDEVINAEPEAVDATLSTEKPDEMLPAESLQEQPTLVNENEEAVLEESKAVDSPETVQDLDTTVEETPVEQPELAEETIAVDDEAIHEEVEAVDATLSVEELDEMLPSPSTDFSTVDPDASFATSGPFALESVMSSIGEEPGDDDEDEDNEDPVLDIDSKVSEVEDDVINGTANGNGHLAEPDVGLSEPAAEASDIDPSLVEKAAENSGDVEDAANGSVVDVSSISEVSPPDPEPVSVALDEGNGEHVHIEKSVLSVLTPHEETEPSVVEVADTKVAQVAANEA